MDIEDRNRQLENDDKKYVWHPFTQMNWMGEQKTGYAETTTPGVIRDLSHIPLLGVLPFDPEIDVCRLEKGDLISMTLKHVNIDKILS